MAFFEIQLTNANTQSSFIPNIAVKPFVPFDPVNKSRYVLNFIINSLTWSTSYGITLDEFDANRAYIGTVWNVFPISSTSTAIGPQNVNLGGFSFDACAAYIMPKINIHTGDGAQTVKIDDVSFNYQ